MNVEITLDGKTAQTAGLPFLVTKIPLEEPIISYNMIEYTIINKEIATTDNPATTERAFTQLSVKKVSALVDLVKHTPDNLGPVTLGKEDIIIPKGHTVQVVCLIHDGCTEKEVAVFEPYIENLPRKTLVNHTESSSTECRICMSQ